MLLREARELAETLFVHEGLGVPQARSEERYTDCMRRLATSAFAALMSTKSDAQVVLAVLCTGSVVSMLATPVERGSAQ